MEKLVDALVVNETFFFRELEPLKLLVNHFIEPSIKAGRRPRIWSAACATGEEPLTLAMLLADRGLLSSVELIASDISQKVLDKARAGTFSRRALRDVVVPGLARKYLREEPDAIRVDPALVKAIDWRRINLCQPAEVQALGTMDVVLCRNVLIYFRDETVIRVLDVLAQALKPQGALFVGVSESLMRFGTQFECEERESVFFYRKTR
jgi:chemotaxis protein methyltransferase CheR